MLLATPADHIRATKTPMQDPRSPTPRRLSDHRGAMDPQGGVFMQVLACALVRMNVRKSTNVLRSLVH